MNIGDLVGRFPSYSYPSDPIFDMISIDFCSPGLGFAQEHFVTLGTFVQLPYVLPPVTVTLDHVHDEQEPDPHVITTS